MRWIIMPHMVEVENQLLHRHAREAEDTLWRTGYRRVHVSSALSEVWTYSGRFHLLHCGGPASAISLLFLFGPESGDDSPNPSLHVDRPLKDIPQQHYPPVPRAPRREPVCQASSLSYSHCRLPLLMKAPGAVCLS